ncbi:MAG: SDR family oxidoreductase [Thermodesulfobacteriota bacterium]
MTKTNYFQGKVAVVTGAGAGIGAELARHLARQGAHVVVTGRSPGNVGETACRLRDDGLSAEDCLLDVSDPAQVEAVYRRIAEKHGRLDLAFHNAGISIAGEMRDLDLCQWKKVIDVNLMGVLYGTVVAYSIMAGRGTGHIVNISSLAGLLPFPVKAPYSATKHAIVGLSTTLRAEAADLGVRVTVACPGLVATDIWTKTPIMGATPEDVLGIIRAPMMSAEKAAEKILEGTAKNRAVITFPFSARALWYLYRIHPGILDPLGRKLMRDFRRAKEKRRKMKEKE